MFSSRRDPNDLVAEKSKKNTFGHAGTLSPTAPRKKNFIQKNFLGDYLIVGLHVYHNENPNGHFRFF
jgi:hypothetical protein